MLKPLLSGSIPVEQFVQTLEKVSAAQTAQEQDVAPFSPSPLSELLTLKPLLDPGSWQEQNQGRVPES